MATEKAENLARRIVAELGIKISSDDPVLALMAFQEEQTQKLAENLKNNHVDFLKSLTEKLIKVGKPKSSTKLITTLIIVNILLTIMCVILGLGRFWTN